MRRNKSEYSEKNVSKKVIVLIVILLITVFMLAFFMIFKIENIDVTGNEKYTDEEIKDYIFENNYERNTVLFFFENTFGKKKEIAFVEDYDIEIESYNSVKITVYEKSIVGYIEYMGNNMYFDKDGMVVESSTEILDNIPKVTGMTFDYIVLYEKLPVENEKVFSLLLDVTQTLEKYALKVDKIYISDKLETTLYIDNVKVELGNSDINEKMVTLNDLYTNLEGYSGTLDMKELAEDGSYTLKRD
ncbi:MAG: cell division protein FtsQ/DivIB [Eubacterium sp.]